MLGLPCLTAAALHFTVIRDGYSLYYDTYGEVAYLSGGQR